MLKNAQELKVEVLKQERQDFNKDIKHIVLQNALSRQGLRDALHNPNSEYETQCHFDIDLKTLRCTDQKDSGRCWIFAGTNILREMVAKKLNLDYSDMFELSQNYVAFFDKLEKTNYLLECCIDLAAKDPQSDWTLNHLLQTGIQDGGQWDMFVNIINKYGVCPKENFPETFASSNTDDIDTLLTNQCRKFASLVHELYLNGKMEEAETLKDEYMTKAHNALCAAFGTPVDSFDFEYTSKDGKYHLDRALTPKAFVEQYCDDINDYVSIINAPQETKPFNKTYTVKYVGNVIGGKNIFYLNLTMAELKELVIKQLKAKSPVWFGSDCMKYRNRKQGTWNLNAFNYQAAFDMDVEFNKGSQMDYCESAMNHAMVITGVSFKDDQSVKWKIENSWGEDQGVKGYFVATDEWFEKYVYQAVINKKFLTKDQADLLDQAPIELEPWDPMGTLAK